VAGVSGVRAGRGKEKGEGGRRKRRISVRKGRWLKVDSGGRGIDKGKSGGDKMKVRVGWEGKRERGKRRKRSKVRERRKRGIKRENREVNGEENERGGRWEFKWEG